jgi:VacB/RNase II family 3'-5' exoribonuclease
MRDLDGQHRQILRRIARRVMAERGLLTDFSADVSRELASMAAAALAPDDAQDLRNLPWCSIDNDDSRDLDQLTVAESLGGDRTRVLVAVADVTARVRRDSAIDAHAYHNTTSVYTPAEIFPMLPEELSTGLTSLNPGQDRLAVVVTLDVDPAGELVSSGVCHALVRNHAKLAYPSVAAWLDGHAPPPPALQAVAGLDANMRLQDGVAQALRAHRFEHGALDLETLQTKAVFAENRVRALEVDRDNRAKDIIENLMIAANGVVSRFLDGHGLPSLRRVVREPRRWERIVELAATHGARLPAGPDSKALQDFLCARRAADPERFPDLSLAVVKLMGSGEYAADPPGEDPPGHFGLAVRDYGHSTAPNRRFPDVATQRLVKAALTGATAPYSLAELDAIARQCTRREDDANKVERQVRKSAAALLLEGQRNSRFEGLVTGAADKGTWVRVIDPPVEGRVVEGERGLDVGDRVTVRLLRTDVEKGFIDFARA